VYFLFYTNERVHQKQRAGGADGQLQPRCNDLISLDGYRAACRKAESLLAYLCTAGTFSTF